MADPERRTCLVCGALRPIDELVKYGDPPKSQSGTRKYKELWYCKDRKHSQTQIARIAARVRP